jgi:hypothetical protein
MYFGNSSFASFQIILPCSVQTSAVPRKTLPIELVHFVGLQYRWHPINPLPSYVISIVTDLALGWICAAMVCLARSLLTYLDHGC